MMRENYTLPRLFIDVPLASDAVIDLPPDQSRYIGTVLRKSVGDSVRVFNGQTGEWRAEMTVQTKRAVQITVIERLRAPKPGPDIWLCFAPIRKHRMGFITEKATELGAARLMPILTRRTQFPKINAEKMRAHAVEAAEQTERLDVPVISNGQSLDTLLAGWDRTRPLIFADEGGDARPALEVLADREGLTDRKGVADKGPKAALLIGPEGGFDAQERTLLRAQDFVRPVTLGPRILRADTAALTLLSLWQACCGDGAETPAMDGAGAKQV